MTTLNNGHIKHFVVHVMNKEQHENAELIEAPAERPAHAAITTLLEHILERYSGRGGKGYGRFKDNRDNYPMGNIIEDYFVSRTVAFYPTSCRMIQHLASRANEAPLSTGGIVVVAHIDIDGQEDVLVAMLTSTVGSAFTDFDITASEYLDIAKLRVAGKIDLTGWTNGRERYISFLKGQNTVAEYFKKFLGCDDVFLAKKETQKLKTALQSFATAQNMEGEAREDFFNRAYDQLKELNTNQQGFDVITFSNAIWPAAPEDLQEVLVNEAFELSDGFVPDGNIIRELVTFRGKSSHWTLKFNRQAVLDGDVFYDCASDIFILRNVPESLRAEMLEEYGTPDE